VSEKRPEKQVVHLREQAIWN